MTATTQLQRSTLQDSLILLATTALVITLTCVAWIQLYPYGTAGTLALLPLLVLILAGSYHTALRRRQASLHSMLTATTPLRRLLKGRLLALLHGLITAAGGILLVAYKSLVAERWEVVLAVAAVLGAGLLFLVLLARLRHHVNAEYLLTAVSNLNVALTGTAFFLIYIYALWTVQEHPTYLANSSLQEAIRTALISLPQGSGTTAVFIEYAYVIETAKRWAVVHAAELTPVIPIIYVLYGAIFGYLQVKVVNAIMCTVWLITPKHTAEG